VNRDLILLYWDIGRGIVEKQETLGWGESVVEMLAKDLQKAFPGMRGFSTANLRAMRRFYLEYGRDSILQQLAEELEIKKHAAILGQPVPKLLSKPRSSAGLAKGAANSHARARRTQNRPGPHPEVCAGDRLEVCLTGRRGGAS
jgi:hypothetical protein